jgi:glycosyltransferase involved in cell wall biosynthesis
VHHCTIPEAAIYVASAARQLPGIVGGKDFDINHTHFILPDGLLADGLRRSLGLEYLITAHGSDVPGYNPHRLRTAHWITRGAWRRASTSAALIVCPSRSIESLVKRRDPALRTHVVPYGFDARRYRTDRAREKRILVVSRLLRRKGIQYLLKAVEKFSLGHEIHIVGDGLYLPELRRLARRTPSTVVFHGWLDNDSERLATLYETSDIFVLTSERENFPVALMEAMSAGLAIVTTEGTGCAEVVGDAAVLVPPKNADALGAAVLSLTGDPERCRALGRAARVRAERELSWEVVADRYLELYASER